MDIEGDFIDWVESASQSYFTEKRLSTSDPWSKQLAESILVSAYSVGIKENTGCIQSAKRIADPIPNEKKVMIVGQSILAAICMGDKRPESPVLFALENGWIDVALHLVKTMPDDMINHFRDLDHLPESFWQTRGLSGENIAKRDQILSLLLEKTDAKWISQQLVDDKAGLSFSYSAGFLQSTQLLQGFWEDEGARVPIDQGFVQPFIDLLFYGKKEDLVSVLLPFVQNESFLEDSVLFSLLTHVAKEKGNADRALFRNILVQFRREARLMGQEKEPEMKEAVYQLLCNTLDFCEEKDIIQLLKIFGPLEDKWNSQNPVKQFVQEHFVQICQKGWAGTARKMKKHLSGMYTDHNYGNLVLGLLNIANPTDEVKKVTADLIKKFHESFGLIGFAVGQAMGVDNRVLHLRSRNGHTMWHMAMEANNHYLISYLLKINAEPFFRFSRSCQCSPLDLVGRIDREVVDLIINFLSCKEEEAEKVCDWIFSRDRFQGRGVFSGTDRSAFAQGLFILQKVCKEYEIGAEEERALFIDLMQVATKKNWEEEKKVITEIIMDLKDEDETIHPLHRDILQNHPIIAHQLFPFFHSLYGDKGLVDAVESFAKPELLFSLLPQELVERVSEKTRCSCQYRVSDHYLTKIQSTLPEPDRGVRCQNLLVLAKRLDGIQKDQETMQALKGLVEGVRSGRRDPFKAIRSGGEIEKNWQQLNKILCLIASNLQGQDKEQQTIVLQDLAAANKYCQTGIVSRVLTSWQLAGGVNTVGLPGQERVFSSLQDLQRGLFVQICNSIRPGWDRGQQGVNTHVLHHVQWCLGKQLRLPEADLFFDDQFQDQELLGVLNPNNAMQIFFHHYCTPSVILEHIQAQVNHDPGVKGAIGRMPIQDLLVEHIKPAEQSAADFYPTIYDEEGNIHLSYIAQVLEKLGILRANTP